MKRFLMFSVSVLCLAIAALIGFHIGSHQVEAQAPPEVQYFVTPTGEHLTVNITAILPNGDVYSRQIYHGNWYDVIQSPGNFWEGAVSTDKSSWGDIKGQFKSNKEVN